MIAANNRARRLNRRRSAEAKIADDVDATDRLAAEGLDPAVAARYTDQVKATRSGIRAEAKADLPGLQNELEAVGETLGAPPRRVRVTDPVTGKVTLQRPGAAGEWDWFDSLDPSTQARLRKNGHVDPAGGTSPQSPDQIAENMRRTGRVSAGASDEEALDAWLGIADQVDDAKSVAAGRPPKGGTSIATLAPDAAGGLNGLHVDPDQFWIDTPELAAAELAIAELEVRARYEATGALQRTTTAPPAWELSAEEYALELAAVDRAMTDHVRPKLDAGPDELLTRDELYAMRRYNELVPEGIVDEELRDRLDAHTLHQSLRWMADNLEEPQ